MSHLVPCPSCGRHVLSAEIACPFCTGALPESLRLQTPAPRAPGRLGRAALMAAGAALMGAEACSAGTPVYGAPTGAGGSGGAGGMMTTDGGSDAPAEGGPVPLYGAPASSDEPAQK